MTRIVARSLVVLAVAAPAWALGPKQLGPQPEPPDKPPVVALAKGTKCTRLAPGRVRLTLPTGAVLELWGCRRDQNRRLVADQGHFVPAPGKPGWTAKGAVIASGAKPKIPSAADYVKIDDEPTWLPALVSFTGSIDPDPPT
jgi:hypothetical protein